MTRVLHVPTVGWQPTEGIARACLEIASELDDCEHMLAVDVEPGAAARRAFAAVSVIPGWSPALVFRREFGRVMRRTRPDVVHLHGGGLAPLLSFSPHLHDVPVVATCYSPAAGTCPPSWRPDYLLEHRTNLSPARLVAAMGGGEALSRHALRTGRTAVVCTPDARIGADFAGAGPVVAARGGGRVRATTAVWSDAPVVVFAGRAQAGRGVDDLIEAFPSVRAAIPGARLRLLLLGGGSAERWQQQCAGLEWADVRVGPIAELADAFAECQLAVFPFRWSATLTPALAAAEAMAVGLPVVATPVECLAPLVDHGVNGALVPVSAPRAVAAAVVAALADEAVWQHLSDGARKTIDGEWSWAGAAAATRDAYFMARRRTR